LLDAYKIVKNSINNNTPIMLWGPPGIGKSSLIHQISAEMNREVLDLRLAQLEPTDLRGVPMPNNEINRAQWYLPAFWPAVSCRYGYPPYTFLSKYWNKYPFLTAGCRPNIL